MEYLQTASKPLNAGFWGTTWPGDTLTATVLHVAPHSQTAGVILLTYTVSLQERWGDACACRRLHLGCLFHGVGGKRFGGIFSFLAPFLPIPSEEQWEEAGWRWRCKLDSASPTCLMLHAKTWSHSAWVLIMLELLCLALSVEVAVIVWDRRGKKGKQLESKGRKAPTFQVVPLFWPSYHSRELTNPLNVLWVPTALFSRVLKIGPQTLLHCWWECKLVQSLWRTVWRFLKKLKIELPYDLHSHSWAYIGEKHDSKGYMHSNVHCSTVYNSQDMEAT